MLKNDIFFNVFLGKAKRGWTHITWTWGAAEAAGTTSLRAGKEKPPQKRPWNGARVWFFKKCNSDFSILSNFCRIETYCVFDGLDEEMILIGMATRRSILSPTSECIKATVDSSIGFQISIPERGVAFQQQLLSIPTRTTGKLFESGWLHTNAFKNANEGFMANQWQLSNWSWFSLE